MRNIALLIRKDFLGASLSGMNVWFMLLFWLVFVAISPSMSGMMFVMLVYLMVIALFATEENELVCNVLGILPIRRRQAVLARYLYAYLVLLGGFAAAALACGAVAAFRHTGGWLSVLLVSAATALLMVDLLLPLIYRFGVVKTRMLTFAVYLIVVIGASVLNAVMKESRPASPATGIGLAVLAASAALSLVSLLVSLRIADKH